MASPNPKRVVPSYFITAADGASAYSFSGRTLESFSNPFATRPLCQKLRSWEGGPLWPAGAWDWWALLQVADDRIEVGHPHREYAG